MTVPGKLMAFYLAHVDDDTDECILWPYGINSSGYGVLHISGRSQYVHTFACERHYGPRPAGMWALHAPVICHNKRCFNWRHLAWGTPVENNGLHKVLDGTTVTGEAHGISKLTREQVNEIRRRHATGDVTQRALAIEYEVSWSTIWHIVHEKSWV